MRHGSLFSGIGGFDLAAEWMGWENVFHCEWMEFPRKVLDYHFPNADSHIDICKTDFKKYANTIDVLTGGFPCQPFSLAGKRKGTDDERYLWGEMLRAIQEIKPTFVIAENVFGITNIDGGLVFQQVCLDLEAEGYEVQPFIIPAAAKNAPHRRDRCWFIAQNPLFSRCVHGESNQEGAEVREFGDTCTGSADGIYLSKGIATYTDRYGFIKGRGYDGISKDVDGSNTSCEWSTNSKDIDGCSTNGVSKDQSTIGSRISQQANAEKNQTTDSRRVCRLDETNKCKGTICKNWVTIDKSRALVQERQSRFFASINRGLGNNQASFGELANMGLSIDLSRINPMDWNATNSNGNGFNERNRNDEVNTSEGGEYALNDIEQVAMHTNSTMRKGEYIGQKREREFDRSNSRNGVNNFQNFPTQSPICCGDDGLPTELDGITFSKWRAESIKGYGNAIVPQIALQLFQILQEIQDEFTQGN